MLQSKKAPKIHPSFEMLSEFVSLENHQKNLPVVILFGGLPLFFYHSDLSNKTNTFGTKTLLPHRSDRLFFVVTRIFPSCRWRSRRYLKLTQRVWFFYGATPKSKFRPETWIVGSLEDGHFALFGANSASFQGTMCLGFREGVSS